MLRYNVIKEMVKRPFRTLRNLDRKTSTLSVNDNQSGYENRSVEHPPIRSPVGN